MLSEIQRSEDEEATLFSPKDKKQRLFPVPLGFHIRVVFELSGTLYGL
jgi:hypothetical protein